MVVSMTLAEPAAMSRMEEAANVSERTLWRSEAERVEEQLLRQNGGLLKSVVRYPCNSTGASR